MKPIARQVDNEQDFISWLGRSRPGDRVVYHQGLLMKDRQFTANGKPSLHTATSTYAKSVMSAADAGMVMLFQKRLDEDTCDYIAVRA